MKKLLIGFSLLLISISVSAQDITPELEIILSPGNLPTQRVHPGDKNVEALRVWFTTKNHPNSETLVKKINFRHQGDDKDHWLRYRLMDGNKLVGKVSLINSDVIEFNNLNINLKDGKTTELRLLGDISIGNIIGTHTFTLAHPEDIFLEKDDIRHPDTFISGDFPFTSNRILIGEDFSTPSSDCNFREEPVCGEDGKTYYNRCITFQKNIDILHEGACTQQSIPEIKPCPETDEPVCGDDGFTYTNQCFLDRKEDVFKKHNGTCFPKSFSRIKNFSHVTDLFQLKQNELESIRPKLSENAVERLQEGIFTLKNYNFTAKNKTGLIDHIYTFLEFTQNPSDRNRLEQEIELLNKYIIEARTQSAQEKYTNGDIPFLDVDDNAWFFRSVQFLEDQDLLQSLLYETINDPNRFLPHEHVTKAEVTKLIFDMANKDYSQEWEAKNPFAPSHWAYNIISLGEKLNLTLWQDQPNPDKKATRLDVIKLIFEVFGLPISESYKTTSFTDVSSDAPDKNLIQSARNMKLVSGYPDLTFRPERIVSRAEVTKIIENLHNILAK